MKCQAVVDLIERLAPKRLAEKWDNPGLLVGSPLQEVGKVYVCLDVSLPAAEEAIAAGADMMVAHHPMIFNGLRHVRTDLYDGKLLQLLLSHNVAVYAAHTNLDIAQGGVNDVLAAAVGLERVEGFAVTDEASGACIGRIGYLPEKLPLAEFARQVKSRLRAECVRVVQGNDRQVQKVALCSGAGADFIGKAAFKGADVYLTGDVKYHDAQKAVQQGINVIDAGHFATEFPVVKVLADYLRQESREMKKTLEVVTDTVSRDYFTNL